MLHIVTPGFTIARPHWRHHGHALAQPVIAMAHRHGVLEFGPIFLQAGAPVRMDDQRERPVTLGLVDMRHHIGALAIDDQRQHGDLGLHALRHGQRAADHQQQHQHGADKGEHGTPGVPWDYSNAA
jgi:hypothetical protein